MITHHGIHSDCDVYLWMCQAYACICVSKCDQTHMQAEGKGHVAYLKNLACIGYMTGYLV